MTDWWNISDEEFHKCGKDDPFITGFYQNISNSPLIKAKCCNAKEDVGSHSGTCQSSFWVVRPAM